MDVALGYASGGMPQKRGDGQFGKAEVAGEAREGVAQSNAFMKSDIADERGLRLKIPGEELMADAENQYPPFHRRS